MMTNTETTLTKAATTIKNITYSEVIPLVNSIKKYCEDNFYRDWAITTKNGEHHYYIEDHIIKDYLEQLDDKNTVLLEEIEDYCMEVINFDLDVIHQKPLGIPEHHRYFSIKVEEGPTITLLKINIGAFDEDTDGNLQLGYSNLDYPQPYIKETIKSFNNYDNLAGLSVNLEFKLPTSDLYLYVK